MNNKFLLNTLMIFGIILVILFSYVLIINSYINEKTSKNINKEIINCKSNWVNYTYENNQTIYLEKNIYRCGNEFKVCDSVNGKECIPSKDFYISTDSGTNVKIGFGDSVSTSVKRNRWYGKIYESDGKSNLYIFDLIKIPIKINNIDLTWYHQLVVMICLTILISFFSIEFIKNRTERRYN